MGFGGCGFGGLKNSFFGVKKIVRLFYGLSNCWLVRMLRLGVGSEDVGDRRVRYGDESNLFCTSTCYSFRKASGMACLVPLI